jgi:hypothetical protein
MQKATAAPGYLSDLTSQEREGLVALRQAFTQVFADSKRIPVDQVFPRILKLLQQFILSNSVESQHRKARACGILWLGRIMATNTRQLPQVLGRSKSWINSGLLSMGYCAVPDDTKAVAQLNSAFPSMRGDYAEARRWTYRAKPMPQIAEPVHEMAHVNTDHVVQEGEVLLVDMDEDLWLDDPVQPFM